MKKLHIILKTFLPAAAIISLFCLIVYGAVQQNYRQSANDPQYQMVQSAADALERGEKPAMLVTGSPVELTHTLSAYLIIYNVQKKLIVSGARLNGTVPDLPDGVINNTISTGGEAVTWQPKPGIRQALVLSRQKNYVIIAGRSLRLVEERISILVQQLVFGWIVSLLIVFTLIALLSKAEKNISATVD